MQYSDTNMNANEVIANRGLEIMGHIIKASINIRQ